MIARPWIICLVLASLGVAAAGLVTMSCETTTKDSEEGQGTTTTRLNARLALEFRYPGHLRISWDDPNEVSGKVWFEQGYKYLLPGEVFPVTGFVQSYPEDDSRLFVLYFTAFGHDGSECPQEINLALHLLQKGSNPLLMGGMTAFCGPLNDMAHRMEIVRVRGDITGRWPGVFGKP